eukprot:351675-Chlamydomonas_euryale.AAC.4
MSTAGMNVHVFLVHVDVGESSTGVRSSRKQAICKRLARCEMGKVGMGRRKGAGKSTQWKLWYIFAFCEPLCTAVSLAHPSSEWQGMTHRQDAAPAL